MSGKQAVDIVHLMQHMQCCQDIAMLLREVVLGRVMSAVDCT